MKTGIKRLKPCGRTRQCVSSLSEIPHQRMEPIQYSGDSADALRKIKRALSWIPRIEFVEEDDNFLHAVTSSKIFRWKDDIQFFYDEKEKLIHFRSGARIGYWDFNVNRRRMEKIINIFLCEKEEATGK